MHPPIGYRPLRPRIPPSVCQHPGRQLLRGVHPGWRLVGEYGACEYAVTALAGNVDCGPCMIDCDATAFNAA